MMQPLIIAKLLGTPTTALLTVALQSGCARVEKPASAPLPGAGLYAVLDPGDVDLARAAMQEALEKRSANSTHSWANRVDGSAGSITPLSTFKTSTGYYCRRFREVVSSGAHSKASEIATACRDDTGNWQRVDL